MNLKKWQFKWLQKTVAMLLVGIAFNVFATEVTKVAVFAFELHDITSLPNTPNEIIRTASLQPLLASAMQNLGYKITPINARRYAIENAGHGYLYKFYETAALLGKEAGSEWVIVGKHSKPSFLFSYIMVNVVNVKTKKQVAHYNIELKGNHQKVTHRAIKAMAKKITDGIKKYQNYNNQNAYKIQ